MVKLRPRTDKLKTTFPRWLLTTLFVSVGLLVIGTIILILLLVGLSHRAAQTDNGTSIIQQIEQYPTAYIGAHLPQYPGADVTNFGSAATVPKDHIVLYITTKDAIAVVANFYDQAMAKLGWQSKPTIDPDSDSTIHTYDQTNQEYTATIIRDQANHRTNILITWIEH